jgi:hypothetical protein
MKLFDVHSAREALPEVRRLMRQAMEARGRWLEVRREMAGFAGRAEALGGAWLDAERAGQWQRDLSAAAARIQQAMSSLEGLGAQVKDLDLGLVDFPTLYRGRQVLLCWQVGEPDIAWWHGAEEGYAGRKRIDGEFLANHRGD